MASDHRGRPLHAGKRTNQEMADFGRIGDHVSFEGFDFSNWRNHERELLTPRLEKAGFSDIEFDYGDRDSFGPLTRVARMTDNEGRRGKAWYG